jgi:hypothetical protein
MSIERITSQNNELYSQLEIKKLDQRHNAIIQEERRIKHQKEVNEQQRIEMNRRMNRPGQNVDKMA